MSTLFTILAVIVMVGIFAGIQTKNSPRVVFENTKDVCQKARDTFRELKDTMPHTMGKRIPACISVGCVTLFSVATIIVMLPYFVGVTIRRGLTLAFEQYLFWFDDKPGKDR